MRSNDAFKGFTHDVFAFTMLQEFVARLLKCELGNYHHYVASMHIYKSDVDKIKNLQNEGFMSTKPLMREMPNISGLDFIDKIMTIEKLLREDKMLDIFSLDIDDYWKDLFRIIKIYFLLKSKNQVDKIFADYEIKQLSNTNYRLFFESR
jgi:thymidylate synthase